LARCNFKATVARSTIPTHGRKPLRMGHPVLRGRRELDSALVEPYGRTWNARTPR
jgi:hypothetical protein